MWIRHLLVLLLVSVLLNNIVFAQQNTVKKDSTLLYKNIEHFSKSNKFKTFVYHLIFKPVSFGSKKKSYKKLIQKPYSTYEGKIIRKINIITLDPFGYSTTDTSVTEQNIILKAANNLHIKTQSITIRNLLLIKINEPFNSFLAKESERLIRSQKYVHDVSFYVVSAGRKSDSADVYIRELDMWSIIPDLSISSSHFTIDLNDKNILGSGHEFKNGFSKNITTDINSFNTDYSIPNIRNTYIYSKLHYGVDGYGNLRRSFTVDRPFYSPLAKWAAGVSYVSQVIKDTLIYLNPDNVPINLKFISQDYWAGKAIQIFKGNTEEKRATNLILTSRYLRVRYTEKPNDQIDPLHIFSNEDFYLIGIGISTRKYVQDRYVFNYGTIEDVPEGNVYEMTGGYQLRNSSWRPYLGFRFSIGNYNEWGYLSSNFEYGTFLHSSHAEQGVMTVGINYFTGLIEIRKWKFRQFVKPQITIGIKRLSYDILSLNDSYGLYGFNSSGLSGTNRLLFTLQTQSYAPWNFIGFHFGPYFTYTLGMLGGSETGFKNSKVYSLLGFGVLIKNMNLIFNTFQFSISFYPSIPGIGQNVLKPNSIKTTDFGFRDFEIGKPVPVVYR
jgi:hypothetical protein